MDTKKIYISEDCVTEILDDELIILNLVTGKYHTLNTFGIEIWNAVKAYNPSFDELIDYLCSKFDGEGIVEDTRKFLREMVDRKIFLTDL